MTLTQLLADCYRRCGFPASVDTATSTRFTAFLNETQQELLSAPGMETLLADTMTFASVASQPTYGLPPAIGRIREIVDATNRLTLAPKSLAWYRQMYPAPTAITGLPTQWIDLGYSPVQIQPSDLSQLYVVSTSAGDTQAAYIEVVRSDGTTILVTCTLLGVTPVIVGDATTQAIEVTKFYLASSAVGIVSLREDSGSGTELARIRPIETTSRYRQIALAVCPSSILTYTMDYQRDVRDMANPTDEPVIPVRFHRLLALGARVKEYEKQDQGPRYQAAKRDYDLELANLKYFLFSQAVGTPNLQGRTVGGRASRLGAWFGPDRW